MENDYNTPLSTDEQSLYDQHFSPEDTADYDMQGWLKDNYEPGVGGEGTIVKHDGGHYPDTYKKPNHMTFSDESQYHGVDGNEGGSWKMLDDGKFAFRPGATNHEHHTTQEMADYFKKVEPKNYLLLGGEE